MADAPPPLDLSRPRHIHITNVGGAGMSAVATVLAEQGHTVTGHDPSARSPFLDALVGLGVAVSSDPTPTLPAGTEVVVTSTATPADHPDVLSARAAGLPVLHRADALAAICAARHVLAVAGTHGKTTTTALLATLLAAAGGGPGWIVGARVAGLGSSAHSGGTGPLVVEADESDGTFLRLGAHGAIVTNVEADHLEHWGTEADLRGGFQRFVASLPGPAVLCLDDPGSVALVAHARRPVTYGTDEAADYRISDVAGQGTAVTFRVHHGAEVVDVATDAAPGIHNARNATAALALAHQEGVPLAEGAAALATFRGVARRFERRGEAGGVVLVDSYDHLPTEVEAALTAARAGGWRRVVCCFQPHRFSRTQALWRDFADCFAQADRLVVTDVYPAGEEPRPGVSGKLIVDAVLDAHPWAQVAWMPTLDDAEAHLSSTLRSGDLCITLGAGDLTTLPDRLLARLEGRGR